MATTRIGAAIDALLALCRAAPGLAGVVIFDGPRVPHNARVTPAGLYLGARAVDDPAAEGDQDFAHLGARARDETFAIACTAEAFSGDTDMKVRRDRALALLAEVENLLRPTDTNPRAYTISEAVLYAHVAGGTRLVQRQTGNGAIASITFHITCRARI
jgi:hypothetical protein